MGVDVGTFFVYAGVLECVHVVAARAVLRARMDVAPNEGALRSNMPVVVKQLDGQRRTIARIADRALRACYLCGEINGQPGVFERESLYHMLLECPHESMVRCRDASSRRCFNCRGQRRRCSSHRKH